MIDKTPLVLDQELDRPCAFWGFPDGEVSFQVVKPNFRAPVEIDCLSSAAGPDSALGFWIGQCDSLNVAPYAEQVPMGADEWRVMLNPMTANSSRVIPGRLLTHIINFNMICLPWWCALRSKTVNPIRCNGESGLGHKRTYPSYRGMSALASKADIQAVSRNGCFVSEEAIATSLRQSISAALSIQRL